MQKIFLLLILSVMAYRIAFAQAPTIYSVDRNHTTVDEIVTISGKNLGNSTSTTKVFFGSAEGKIVSVTDNLVKAKVPAGVTFSKISITNLSTRLTAYAALPFYPSFGGSAFNATNLSIQQNILEEDELFDICVCDFDNDGRNDAGTTNNSNLAKYTSISVYKNNSTPSNISFQAAFGTELNVSRETRNITCGDLNGDGKPELLVSQGGNAAERIYVLKNISPGPGIIKFEGAQILSLGDGGPTNGARRIAIGDMDGDGKPEIIVSNQNVKQLVIFGNESENGLLRFPLSSIIKLDVPSNTLGLTIQDLDGDFLPEIITGNNLSDNIYYLKNKSFPGNIAFERPVTLKVPGLLVNLIAGDIDGDDKPDLAAADFNSGNILVLLNQSAKNFISFSSPQKMLVSVNPWGLDMGDVNGDGKLDLAVSSMAANDKNIILINKSTINNVNFQSFRVGNKEITRNIKIADFNGDAKPDIGFTAQQSNGEFYFSTLQNTTCVTPTILPSTPDPVCAGTPVTLSATRALLVTYQWQKNGVDIPGATESTLEVSSAGDYTVTIVSSLDGCAENSTAVTVTEKMEAVPPTPTIMSSGNVCEGEQLQLSPASPITGATYYWFGPNQFTYTGQNPTINQVDLKQSGEYFLQAGVAGCKSDTASTEILVNPQPDYEIVASNDLSFCQGETTELMIAQENDLQYQWFKDNQPIQGAVSYNLQVTESGSYHVDVGSLAGCSQNTSPVDVLVIEKPNVSFTIAAPKFCINEEISYTNLTTFNNKYSIIYDWKFGDGSSANLRDPKHSYAMAKDYRTILTASYENYDCSASFEQMIQVSDLPQVNIIAEADIHCEGDSVLLNVNDAFATIIWSDGQNTKSIYVSQGGDYSVTVTNTTGCENSAQLSITSVSPPEILVSADKTNITSEETVALLASGGINYVWSPATGLNDTAVDNPMGTPLQTTVYKVIGTDSNGCTGTDSVKINVKQIINISPKNMFSPNNDGIDDIWEVNNIENYPDCKISVFNLQGRNVYEASPYLNNWDGNDTQGKPLLEGVYYYTIRCNGNKKNETTGSITLIR